ncbi:MAG: GNAT family N-acetyltransferase [Candidatus Heimdallarchaeota archaeon]
MSNVIQITNFEQVKPILTNFYIELQSTEEHISNRVKDHEVRFNRVNFVYFLLESENDPKGFIVVEILEDSIRTFSLYVKECDNRNELMISLIVEVTKLLEPLGKRDITFYSVKSLEIEQQLIDDGFKVHQRVNMIYNLKENEIPKMDLAIDYTLANFTLDRLDEELQLVVDANKGTLDGEIIRLFENLEVLKDVFYSNGMDTDRLRKDSPIILKDGKIVGVNIISNLSETAAYVWIIALLSGHRGKGLGKYLMLETHERCKKAGLDEIVLDVTAENVPAHSLYKKLGYEERFRYLFLLKDFQR